MYPGAILIKEGSFLYDGIVSCSIKIFKHNIRYGSGDHKDVPEIRNDQEGEYYYIGFGSTTERSQITSGSNAIDSLEAAIEEAENATQGKITWK
jgi:hypothetical protein